MNKNIMNIVVTICSLVFLFALQSCGGGQAAKVSDLYSTATEYNQKGVKAAKKGDYDKAILYQVQALKINRSIENTDGIAINLINLSVIYQKKNINNNEVHKFVDEAFAISTGNNALRSEAAFEKSRLYLKEKKYAEAKDWAEKALGLNKGARDGSRLNIIGQVTFHEGKYDDAVQTALNALKLNKENNQKNEESNSLKLIAEIYVYKKQYNEAKELYLRALEIDKESGESNKIAMTLGLLGELSLKQNKPEEAADYYKRAFNVSSSAEDYESSLRSINALIETYKISGDKAKVEEMLKIKNDIEKKLPAKM